VPSPDTIDLQVEGLTKRFGELTAVDDVSFTAAAGRVTVLAGANGSGKTTTLRMLVGLVRPTAGTATFGGVPYDELRHPQHTVGALMDVDGLDPGRRAVDHLRVARATVGGDGLAIDHLLAQVELTEAADRPVRALSLGMRQRLGLAAALVGDPRVLVLDEPANGLDPAGLRWLRELVRRVADEGRTVLLSTHQLRDVDDVADDVVLLRDGRVVRAASLDEVRDDGVVSLVDAHDLDGARVALQAAGVEVLGRRDGLLRVAGDPEQILAVTDAAGIDVRDVRPDRRSVEDAFFDPEG
jgi:ABC-2 type transport system ATP-binding protein